MDSKQSPFTFAEHEDAAEVHTGACELGEGGRGLQASVMW